MRIEVKAKTRAKEEKVEQVTQPSLGFEEKMPVYRVSVKEAPERGRANDAIERLLAEHFHVPGADVRLVSGHASKRKIFEIMIE